MIEQDFEFEALLKPEDVAQHLRSIAQGLEKRRIRIERGGESLELDVPESVEFRLTGKFREDEQRIRVQFTLRGAEPAGAPELSIQ
ncbi:MAG TPA: amphi-Trp domain-containing protein [Candidatus Brocadiia bacterium]|nr:amphi-Trp domain-containing protein [Candidatus Brocadiia bacterium]